MTEESYVHYLDTHNEELYKYIADLYEIDTDGKPTPAPYWYEEYYNKQNNFHVQYIPGYWEPYKYGKIIEIEGVKYLYTDSINLSEELEVQEEDLSVGYVYIGSHFLRVLEPIEKVED